MATADMTDKIKMSSLPLLQHSQTYGLPKTHFFSYLQIRSFVQKTFISFPDKPTKTQYDCILELNSDRKGLISQVYGFFININPHSTAHLKRAWDTDLGVDLTEDQWDSILDLIHTSFTSALHGLIQMKVVHRVHLTNARLAKIYPNIEPLCPRCRGQPADLIQTSRHILPSKAYVVIAFTTLLARCLILFKWKQQTPPSFSKWIQDIFFFLKLEKIKYTLKGSAQTFVKVWRPFLDFYDSLQEPLHAD